MAFGLGALVAGAIVRDKVVSCIFVGAGVTATGITIASLFNPLHIVPIEDTVDLVSRHERAAAGRATGQSGSGRIDIPRTLVPAAMVGATSVDEYLTGRRDTAQLRKYGTEDEQTMYQKARGQAFIH